MRARLRRGRARRDVAEHVRQAVGAGDGLPRRAHRRRRGKRAAPLRGRAEPTGGARDGSRDTEPAARY